MLRQHVIEKKENVLSCVRLEAHTGCTENRAEGPGHPGRVPWQYPAGVNPVRV